MPDSDLAKLYQVPIYRLNEAVKRNSKRFPDDFMFQLTKEEFEGLRSQFAISKRGCTDQKLRQPDSALILVFYIAIFKKVGWLRN